MIGAFSLVVLPTFLPGGETAHDILTLTFGLAIVASSLQQGRHPSLPAASLLSSIASAIGPKEGSGRSKPLKPSPTGSDEGAVLVRARHSVSEKFGRPGLEVRDLKVRFGGHLAVDDASLEAPMGRITGLIGPNGAGKTTTFNACSGLLRPSAGQILLKDEDISSRPPALRARLGLGRTFQRMQLFDSMTVAENISLGREAELAGGNFLTQILSKPGDRDAECTKQSKGDQQSCTPPTLTRSLFLLRFHNKLLVLFQWAWNYITRKRGAQLITGIDA